MKKTLIMIFTVFVIALTVFAVFAADNFTGGNKAAGDFSAENSVFTTESENTVRDNEASSTENTAETVPDGRNFIGIDAAKKAAADYIGADFEEVRFVEKDFDIEFIGTVYELQLCYKGIQYDCDIHAKTGKVVKCEKEFCDEDYCHEGFYEGHTYHQGEQHHSYVNERATQEAASSENTTSNVTANENKSRISAEEAKLAALNYTAVSFADAVFTEADYDFDDGRYIYEINFCSNATEYECTVDAYSGSVLHCEREHCDEHRHSGNHSDGTHHSNKNRHR